MFPSMPIHAFSPFACYNNLSYKEQVSQHLEMIVSSINRIYTCPHKRKILTFPCRAVIVLITLTPQFCAKVRGIASKATAAAS